LVSVVVPTFDSDEFLKECLRSIREQIYGNVEIIVVDHYSTDKTKEIAENSGARVIESNAKRSEARNIGAGKAKGNFVFFVDSDMELNSTVIEKCVEKIRNGCDAVIVPEVSVGEGFWAKCKALEKNCYIGDASIEAARFFKRDVFESTGGYDSELEAGEDWDLDQRICNRGYQIKRINVFIKHNEGKLSLQETMAKKNYYGKTIKLYRIKYPGWGKQQLKPFRSAFLRNWRRLAKDPIHALGMVFMKFLEFVSFEIGLEAC